MSKLSIVGLVLFLLVIAGLVVLLPRSGPSSVSKGSAAKGSPYHELVDPSGFVNTNGEPITIGQYVGKNVILLDVMTYSCINCQRTFPYVTAWYKQYKDDGLIVIGIHTPEFAFEKDIGNVEAAMRQFGITFPVVLDNDYGTWNAYGNRYWPRKYLIDIHGNVVYDHIGEGAYEETEMKIRDLLKERAEFLGQTAAVDDGLAAEGIAPVAITARSPETYLGSARNEYLANGRAGTDGVQTFSIPRSIQPNLLYLGGTWNLTPEYAEAKQDATITYRYNATGVYLVASSDDAAEVEVWQDGARVDGAAGEDARDGRARITTSRLYRLIDNGAPGAHTIELRVPPGVRCFAFTFG